MKKLFYINTLLCIILFSSCRKQPISPDKFDYKGGALHAPISMSVFPKKANYTFLNVSDTALKNKLDTQIQNLISTQDVAGISISMIIPGKGIWQLDTGFISKENNIPVDNSSVFYWASVGKLITSTIIHQLILDEKINGDDKLSKWFPLFKYSENITIEHLLNHTNGIYSFNYDSTLHFSNQYHAPEELLEVSLANNNLFAPGEYWSYTNTGYLLLALIAEKTEDKSFSEIVTERIATPQNLSSIKALNPNEQPTNLALTHKQGVSVASFFSTPLGAGNIIGNSKDLALFLHAFLTGEYLPIEIAQNMLSKLYPMFDKGQYYGSGIMLYDFNEINNTQRQWIGHSGGTENYKSILVYDIQKQTFCAVSVNQDIPAEAIANRMLDLID